MKKIITYGTFDAFHYGHVRLLQRARMLGDYLIVGLSTDYFNSLKNKTSHHTWEERKLILESIRCVDLIIPENTWEQKLADIKNYTVDTFVIGDDWRGHFDFLSDYCDVVYLPRTIGVSSTELKKLIK